MRSITTIVQPNEIKLGTSGAPTAVVGLTYNYGTTSNNGNILSISYSGGGLSYTQSFGYDGLNRLMTSQETNGGTSWSQTNGYDRYGNRWVDLGGGSQSLYFNAGSNRITGSSYDSAGNLLNDGSHSYTFNGENMIRTVDSQSAYVYNGEGQRVRKLLGENLRFIYGIGGELLAEFDGASGALKKEHIYGASGLVATIEPTALNSNGTRYSTPDHLGSPRVLTNSSAGVVSRHDYMPFGEELGAGVGGRTAGMGFSVADGVRQKFTSYERDSESALDYAGARFYSSSQGRFTSIDPLLASAVTANPQTFNRYSYVSNAALTQIDPTGMFGINAGGGGSGIPLVSFNCQANEEPQQPPQQPQQAAQPTPNPPAQEPQVPTGVKLDIVEPRPYGNLPLGGNKYFSGMAALMVFTVTDQKGKPMSDVTVSEAVTPASTVQNSSPVTHDDGQIVDLVGRGSFGPQLTNEQARAVATDARNEENNIVQDHVMFIMSSSGRSAIATHSRTFSNVDANGNLRPVVFMNNYSNNYTITYTEIKVTPVPLLICPRVFR